MVKTKSQTKSAAAPSPKPTTKVASHRPKPMRSGNSSAAKSPETTPKPTMKRPKSTPRPPSAGRAAAGEGPSNAKPTSRTPASGTPPRSRKSPARVAKTKAEPKPDRKSGKEEPRAAAKRGRKPKLVLPDSDSDSDIEIIDDDYKPKATAVRGRTRKIDVELLPLNLRTMSEGLVKRMRATPTEGSQKREVEPITHFRAAYENNTTVTTRLGEFSDEDEIVNRGLTKCDQKPSEFGGWFGAVFLLIMSPLSIIALHLICDQYTCSFGQLFSLPPKTWKISTYLDPLSILAYISYVTFLAVLSALPFGGPKISGLPNKHGKFDYVMNGAFNMVVVLIVFLGLEFYGIKVSDFTVKHLFHLLIAAILVGVFLTLYAYVRSFYVPISALNLHGQSNSALYNFFIGRELNPRIGGVLDLKLFVLRLSLIGGILLNCVYMYKSLTTGVAATPSNKTTTASINGFEHSMNYVKSLNWQPTLVVYFIINNIYLLDGIIFEPTWITSFEMQQEGFGYSGGLGYSIYPFMVASVVKYIVDYNVRLPVWQLVAISIVFLVGYVLFRGSNSQKDAFRKNPYSPAVAHLESIPTTQGKKLLVSGYWGFVRHPNYLGDILMNLALLPFVLCVPPCIVIYSIVILLVHRSVRDNVRCTEKYGVSWERYCNRVRYVLLPKVY